MKKYIKFINILLLIIFLISLMFSCEHDKKYAFPKDKNGYPMDNIVLINGKPYELKEIGNSYRDSKIKHEIEIKLEKKEKILVVLPQKNPINLWSLEDREDINLISYSKVQVPVDVKYVLEGESSVLQCFEFEVGFNKMADVSFKWSNVNDIEKSFKDKEANYILTLKLLK